ncbi:MAG: LamG-like jellyroll fold domain-containing protein [Planctomycetota bacterium]|jgi:hypothetical protein
MILNTHPDMPIKIGTQNENNTGSPSGHYFSGSIARVRIHDGVLSPADILNNFHEDNPVVFASNPDPADGVNAGPEVWEGNVYMILNFTPGAGSVTNTAYFSDVERDVIDRDPDHSLGDTPPWPGQGFVVGYDDDGIPEYARAPLVAGTTYYWAIDCFDGATAHSGAVWSFTVMSEEAWGPNPADGESLVVADPSPTLTWNLGNVDIEGKTLSYNMYIGTDRAAVEAVATGDTVSPLYADNVDTESFLAEGLGTDTEYFWRVDTRLAATRPPFPITITKGNVWSFTTAPPGIGTILREWWAYPTEDWNNDLNILKNDPRYPDNPDGSEEVTIFEGPTNWDPIPGDIPNSYGSRLHGWLHVAESGDYTFWIASDDNGELWLSTDEDPANAVLISYVTAWAVPRDFDDPDVFPSDPIYLEGGRKYYISGIMKEGGGGDNIAAAWSGPDTGDVREVIPGNHLSPFVPVAAHNPDPADASFDAPLDVVLRWLAGIDESTGSPYTTQRVYIGSDPIDVANATTESPEYEGTTTDSNQYGPLSLSYYDRVYWRIDGVSPDTGAVQYPGPVWTFKAAPDPGAIVDPNLRLWLKFDGDALDSSGYGRDGTEINGPYSVGSGGATYSIGYDDQAIVLDGADDYVDLPIGADIASLGSSTFAAWVNFSNLGGAWQRIFDFGSGTGTYLFLCPRIGTGGVMRFAIKPPGAGEQIVDTTDTLAGDWHHLAVTIDAALTTANVYLDGEVVGTNAGVTLTPSDVGHSSQNWIGRSQFVADGYFNGAIDDFRIYDIAKDAMGVAEIMRINLSWAWNPSPENRAQDVGRNVTMSWNPGDGATAHSVYLGADDPANMILVAGPQAATEYTPPGGLDLGTTYYWAVTESPAMETGRTWEFTTSNYLTVDNMESYTPWTMPGNNIFEAWRDGEGNCIEGNGNDTGSTVTENMDASFVLGGLQSMKYEFDNDGLVYSPCTMTNTPRPYLYSRIEAQVATLPSGIGANWTVDGVKALQINFMGQLGNSTTEPLWVQLQDSSKTYGTKVFYGDQEGETIADMNNPSWHQWDIDLADFNVNLTNVVSIVIGIGNEGSATPGGSGTIYIDEIRLYTPRCMPNRAKPEADFDNSCQVDYPDVAELFEAWLLQAHPEDVWTAKAPWTSVDVGDVNQPGNFADLGGGQYTITGGGADIWGANDAFHYAYKPLSGDGQMTVRVTDISGPSTNDWRKAGIMIRETLDPDSSHAFMCITPAGGGGSSFQWRSTLDGDNNNQDGPAGVTMPQCIRLLRMGDEFRAFRYAGGEWVQHGNHVTVPMAQDVYIGLAVTSHDYNNETTATFDRLCNDDFVAMDLVEDNLVNFEDYAELLNQWLDQVFWP